MGIAVVAFGGAYVRRYVGGRVALDVQYDLRNAIFERLQRLDFASHDEHADRPARVAGPAPTSACSRACCRSCRSCVGNLVLFVVSLVVMLVPVAAAHARRAGRRPGAAGRHALRLRTTVFPASWDAQQRAGEVAGVVDEAVTGVRVVKGFGQERPRARPTSPTRAERPVPLAGAARAAPGPLHADAAGDPRARPGRGARARRLAGASTADITLGTFLAFSTLPRPARRAGRGCSPGSSPSASRPGPAASGSSTCSTPPRRSSTRPDAVDAADGRAARSSFDDVTFGYLRPSRCSTASTLTRRAGRDGRARRARRGSGKSTVALLLPRFYDVQRRARSRIDGVDVRDVTLDSLRRQIGVVFEDTFLFSDTVRANIAYGRPDATDEEVEAAARGGRGRTSSSATLPDGYDTVVGERGLTLSGGQRQRIALARALLTDPADPPARRRDVVGRRRAPRRRSTTTLRAAHGRAARRSSSPTAARRCASPTASSWSTTAGWSTTAPTTSCSARCRCTARCSPGPATTSTRSTPRRPSRRADEHGRRHHRGGVARRRVERGRRATGDGAPRRTGAPIGRRRRRAAAAAAGGMRPGGRRPSCSPRLDALPPADDEPDDRRRPRRPRPSRRLPPAPVPPAATGAPLGDRPRPRRRSTRSLTLAGPVARPPRHRPRRRTPATSGALWLASRRVPASSRSPTGSVMWAYTRVTGRTAERLLLRAAGPDLRPPPAAVARLLRPRDGGPDHDPHDDRHRRAVAAAADRAASTRSSASSPSSACWSCCVVMNWQLALVAAGRSCRRCSSRRLVPAPLGAGLRPGPRPHRGGQRQPPGEPLGRAGGAGVRPRGRATSAGFRQRRRPSYLDARLGAQRLVAIYFPFVEFLSTSWPT